MNKRLVFGGLVLIWLVAVFSFYPSLRNGFTNWDDDEYLTENSALRQWSWSNLKMIFTTFSTNVYVPLAVTTYALEFHFCKLNPFVYHLDNLILHLFNLTLVFFLVLSLTEDLPVAGLTALLFGIHPLRVESVAWVTERKDVLYSFCYLAAIAAYLRYRTRNRRSFLFAALFLFLLSLLAKPMALTLPFVLLLVDHFQGRKIDRRTVLEKIPFFILAVLFLLINLRGQGALKHSLLDFGRHFFIGSYCFLFYLGKLTVPMRLSSLYPFPRGAGLPWFFAGAPFLLALLLAAAWHFGRRSRTFVLGGLFFLITVLPVCQFIPLAGPALTADRYVYLPSIGLLGLFSAAVFRVIRRPRKYRILIRAGSAFLIAAVIIVFSLQTRQRCRVWQDGITLWTDVIAKYPDIPQAYDNRGILYAQRSEYARAIGDFSRALDLNPRSFKAYNNRGLAYFFTQDNDRANRDFSAALRINPAYADAYNNRGFTANARRDYPRAIADFDAALRLKPDFGSAYLNRGIANAALGKTDEALADLTRATELLPRPAEAYNNRGIVYAGRNESDRALDDFNRALDLNPAYADAYNNRGNVYRGRGDLNRAIADFGSALKADPRLADALYNRAVAYFLKKDYPSALADLKKYEDGGGEVPRDFYRDLRRAMGRLPLK
jgi:tetratricopeptide (TPR) repeat protein